MKLNLLRSQVLKELGIEDPLLNVAQELEKVPRFIAPKVFFVVKKTCCFSTLEPQNYEKCRFCRFYTPEI